MGDVRSSELREYAPAMLGEIPPIVVQEGKLTEGLALVLTNALRALITKVNGLLSLGSGEAGTRSGNVDGMYMDVLTPAVADTEFPVLHRLGRVPVGWAVVGADKAVRVYSSNTGSWGFRIMYLKADVTSASIRLWVW